MRCLLFLILASFSFGAQAQYSEWINTGRPGQSAGPLTIGKNVVQIETGFGYLRLKQIGRVIGTQPGIRAEYSSSQNRPKARLRVGITEWFEVSGGVNYFWIVPKDSETEKAWKNGFVDQYDLTLQANIYKGKGAIPAVGVGLQTAGLYPKANGLFGNVAFTGIIALQSNISSKFSLTSNAILSKSVVGFTFKAGYQFVDRFGVFAEYYPTFSGLSKYSTFVAQEGFLNTGLTFKFSRNFQFDFTTTALMHQPGVEKSSIEYSKYFGFQVGLSGRIDWRD